MGPRRGGLKIQFAPNLFPILKLRQVCAEGWWRGGVQVHDMLS
jgi:hypothetical protein